MSGTILDIADAVVLELNEQKFGRTFEAKRDYVPVFELEDMDCLHVTVVPRSLTPSFASRALDRRDLEIDIGIQQRPREDDSRAAARLLRELCDGLMPLIEEIIDHFSRQARSGRPLAHFPAARILGVTNNPIYDPKHMEELRQFTTVVSLSLQHWKEPD